MGGKGILGVRQSGKYNSIAWWENQIRHMPELKTRNISDETIHAIAKFTNNNSLPLARTSNHSIYRNIEPGENFDTRRLAALVVLHRLSNGTNSFPVVPDATPSPEVVWNHLLANKELPKDSSSLLKLKRNHGATAMSGEGEVDSGDEARKLCKRVKTLEEDVTRFGKDANKVDRLEKDLTGLGTKLGKFNQYKIKTRERLATLETDNTALNEQVAALQEDNVTSEGKLATLETDNAALKEQVAALQEDKVTSECKLATLETDNAALKEQVAALQEDKVTSECKLATLETDNAALKEQVAALEGKLTTLETGMGTLNTRMSALEATAGGKELQKQLEDHGNKIKGLAAVVYQC